jgi:Zn-dependent peptidase ImmA (M78 family)/plasmid maintenance system antidote protein VapI
MADTVFRPNWVSPPGETIRAVLHARGVSFAAFRQEIGLAEEDAGKLLAGVLPVTPTIAKGLAHHIGSTATFWLERQKQYQDGLKQLATAEPELTDWVATFPVKKMVESGWLSRPHSKDDLPSELLDYFDIETVQEWRENYLARLGVTRFRTSGAFENVVFTTVAWIRHGELLAEKIACQPWDRNKFLANLGELKALSKIEDPKTFVRKLQQECAKYGVAVVVTRSITGCAASGATLMLEKDKALLLLSGRFLSDDQFWFSFFHEAAHLVLHNQKPHIDHESTSTPQEESEANHFAQRLILEPEGDDALLALPINQFSIGRFARRCGVSPGVIVGQLQHRGRISPKLFNKLKVRYPAASFSL